VWRLFLLVLLCGSAVAQTSDISGWNGRVAQVNLSPGFPVGGQMYAPVNKVNDCQDWSYGDNSGPVNISEENQFGFPTNNTSLAAHSGWNNACGTESITQRPGNRIVDWVGANAKITFVGLGAVVSVSGAGCSHSGTIIAGTNCSVTFTGPTANTFRFIIQQVGIPQLTQLRVYHADDTTAINNCTKGLNGGAAYLLESCFASQFLQAVSDFGVVRDLNVENANATIIAKWIDRTPLNFWSWGAAYYPSSVTTTNKVTLSSGASYTLSFPEFVLSDKVHIIAQNASTIPPVTVNTSGSTGAGACTLNFGALPPSVVAGMLVYDNNSSNAINKTTTVQSVGPTTVTISPCVQARNGVGSGDTIYFSPMLSVNGGKNIPIANTSGSLNTATLSALWTTFTYDVALNVWMAENASNRNSGLNGGWPPEIMVALANVNHSHPWNVPPPYSLDPPTDYAVQQAQYQKRNLAAGLIPRFECGPNELWNYAFYATTYADNREYLRDGKSFDHDNWYGQICSEMAANLGGSDGVWPNKQNTKYWLVTGMTSAAAEKPPIKGTCTSSLCQDNKIAAPTYVTEGGVPAYTYGPVQVAYAGYWNTTFYGTLSELEWAWCYANQANCSVIQSTLLTNYAGTGGSAGHTISSLLVTMRAFQNYFKSYSGTATLSATQYEGGNVQTFSSSTQKAMVASVTIGNPTVLTLSGTVAGGWDWIYNTNTGCSSCTTTLIAGVCSELDGERLITAATATTITLNVATDGRCMYSGGGTAAYDGSGTFVTAFKLAFQRSSVLTLLELQNLQNFYSVGGTFPSEFDLADAGSWGKYNPDVYATQIPAIQALRQLQTNP